MSNRINNGYNMKLIRKAMIDLDLNSMWDLAKHLFMSETSIRLRLNGGCAVRKSDIVFMEQRLNVQFDWNEFTEVRKNYYLFFNRNKNEAENG